MHMKRTKNTWMTRWSHRTYSTSKTVILQDNSLRLATTVNLKFSPTSSSHNVSKRNTKLVKTKTPLKWKLSLTRVALLRESHSFKHLHSVKRHYVMEDWQRSCSSETRSKRVRWVDISIWQTAWEPKISNTSSWKRNCCNPCRPIWATIIGKVRHALSMIHQTSEWTPTQMRVSYSEIREIERLSTSIQSWKTLAMEQQDKRSNVMSILK